MRSIYRATGIFVALFAQFIAFGQSPYDSFEKEQKTRYNYRLPEMVFKMENVDTTDIIRYMELDIETLQLKYFSLNDSLLAEIELTEGTIKFISRDPKFEKYFWASPYAYCLSNPVNAIDPDGKDVVILNAPQGAGGRGHMAALIQDKQGNWYYMTMGARGNGNLSQVLSSGVAGGMRLESCGTQDVNDAIKYAKMDKNNSEYTQELVFKTSSKMDGRIYQSAINKQNKVNSGEEEYKALTNSCADAVKDVIEGGIGIKLPSKTNPYPNSYFEKLEQNKTEIQTNIKILIESDKFGEKVWQKMLENLEK